MKRASHSPYFSIKIEVDFDSMNDIVGMKLGWFTGEFWLVDWPESFG